MAHLEIIDGPDAGHRHELKTPSVVMGRHPDCELVLDVGAVSRKHAKIERHADGYFLLDLKSRNGTLLNDLPVTDRLLLNDGDQLQICDVTLLFRNEQQPKEQPPRANDSSQGARMVDDEENSGTQIMDTIGVSSGSGTIQLAASAEAKLNAIVEINRHLGRRLAMDDVLPKVLEGLFKIFVQADRGFIILKNEQGNLIPKWTKLRREDSDEELRISRTIVHKVIDTKEAVLSADASSDSRFEMSASIANFSIRSMMCAPLIDGDGNAFGALQIDTLDQRKRFQTEDLDILASIAGQAGIAIDNAKLYEQALKQRDLDRDLELARMVQRGIVPEHAPGISAYEFYHFYEAANQVGGDYFDYVPLSGGRYTIVVADVVGHGVPAALLMARLSSQVRFCLASGAEPGEALAQVNNAFGEIGIEGRFVTFWLGVLDPANHTLTVANAGHMPTMIRRTNGDVVEVGENETGLPVGVMDDVEYDQLTIELSSGEMVVMYTDGVNEAADPADELYSIDRIRQRCGAAGSAVATLGKDIIDDVQRFMRGAPQGDDMCLVCFGRVG